MRGGAADMPYLSDQLRDYGERALSALMGVSEAEAAQTRFMQLARLIGQNPDQSFHAAALTPELARELQGIMREEGLLAHGTTRRWRPWEEAGNTPLFLTPDLGHAMYYSQAWAQNPDLPKLHLFKPQPGVLESAPTYGGNKAWEQVIYPLRSFHNNLDDVIDPASVRALEQTPIIRLENILDMAFRRGVEFPTHDAFGVRIPAGGDTIINHRSPQYVIPDPITWLDRIMTRPTTFEEGL